MQIRSRTDQPYHRGPATVGVQLLSDCRTVPDSEGTDFDVCLSEATYRFSVTL